MREREGYRDNLEIILKHFRGKPVLTPKEVAEWTGKTVKKVRRDYEFTKKGGRYEIKAQDLARQL